MEKIALLGATGSLGRALGSALGAAGIPYRAVSRSQMGLQVRFGGDPMAHPLLWDPEQSASILHALQGVETAIYLVGVPLWEFAQHLALTRRVLEAAKTAGTRRLLLVSSNWAYGSPQRGLLHNGRIPEAHPLAAQTVKGRVRAEQEQMVLAAHLPGVLETSVLRIADFYGPYVEASYLWSAFRAAKNQGHAQVLAPADTPHEFVYAPDAARTITRMLDVPEIWSKPWNLAGPAASTIRTMVEAIFAEAGSPPNYEITPGWKLRLVRMMNPYVRELREMQYLLQQPILLDDSALSAALGGIEKTAHAEGIRETLKTVGPARR